MRKVGGAVAAVAGPEALELRSDVPLQDHDFQDTAEFTVGAGQRVGFVLTSHPLVGAPATRRRPGGSVQQTEAWWREWSGRSTYRGGWADEVDAR